MPTLVAAVFVIATFVPCAFADSPATAPAKPAPLKVLFIGNSQMAVFALPQMVQGLSESAPADSPRIQATQALIMGASLKTHWNSRGTRIEAGHWDYVVIQEVASVEEPEFATYAAKFDELIRKSGAKTLIFATANGSNNFPDSTKHIDDYQIAFGKKMGIPVAAAGYAYIKYLGAHPTDKQVLDLYHPDKGHPGINGTYIYACLLYACLTGHTPVGLTNQFKEDVMGGLGVKKEEAVKMQQAAWEQYLEGNKK